MLSKAMATVLAQNGINPDDLLEDRQKACLLLDKHSLQDSQESLLAPEELGELFAG